MSRGKYIANGYTEPGGHFFGACALSSTGYTKYLPLRIASSVDDGFLKRAIGDSFSIWFKKEKALPAIRRSFEAQEHDRHLFFIGEAFNLEEIEKDAHSPHSYKGGAVEPARVALELYLKYGIDFPSRINGFFSIIVWDAYYRSLVIYADRFGSALPIYYSLQPYGLVLASQLKILVRIFGKDLEIDPGSLAIFLKYSYVPAPRTILRGVFKLGPGEMLIYKGGNIQNQRYDDFSPVGERSFPNENKAAEEYLEILSSSIRKKEKGFDSSRVGFFLSGGLDSSANVALASMSGLKNFKTFGIGFKDPKIDERPYARIVADHFRVPFHEYVFDGSEIEDLPRMVWHLDEPFMENGLFLTYAGFKAAKGEVDLIIAGDGADQLFGTGGFAEGRPIALRYLLEKFRLRKAISIFRHVLYNHLLYKDNFFFKSKVMLDRSVDFNDWFFWGFDEKELAELCRFSIDQDSFRCFSNDLRQVPKTFASYYHHALIHQDLEHYACQNVLFKSSRMAEMFGIKLREAYLDKDVIEFVLSTDFKLKTKGSLLNFLRGKRVTKYLHRLSMARLLPSKVLESPAIQPLPILSPTL